MRKIVWRSLANFIIRNVAVVSEAPKKFISVE